MPSYTFNCSNCGEFTLFFTTMAGNKGVAGCPGCKLESTRVYRPPNLYSYSQEIRTRVEKGMEPRRVTREALGPKQKKKPPLVNRPWQV